MDSHIRHVCLVCSWVRLQIFDEAAPGVCITLLLGLLCRLFGSAVVRPSERMCGHQDSHQRPVHSQDAVDKPSIRSL